MFNYDDRVTLTGGNVIDRNGNVLSIVIRFPLEENFKLPDNIRQISIFEYDYNNDKTERKSFNIYVGKTCTLLSFFSEKSDVMIEVPDENFKIGSDLLCYTANGDGINVLFANVKKGDIVVSNNEELKFVLETISREFGKIKKSVNKIKNLSKGNR